MARIFIPLLGKGATNHLHRESILDVLIERGFEVTYLVREDFAQDLNSLDRANYQAMSLRLEDAGFSGLRRFCQHVREIYPSSCKAHLRRVEAHAPYKKNRCLTVISRWLAGHQILVDLILKLEHQISGTLVVEGVNPQEIDLLLLLGVGTIGAEMEGHLTRWAEGHQVRTIHYIGNYDNLTSKGYRGADVEQLMVWGELMEEDATRCQGIASEKLCRTGSMRYDGYLKFQKDEAFLSRIGLESGKPLILFAGSTWVYHYYEMLEVYKQLKQESEPDLQLIMRVYPNKNFTRLPEMLAFIYYVQSMDGVYVSIGDPNFKTGNEAMEVVLIEEEELLNSLSYASVVVNLYSTMAVEACMFDVPAIHMWYFPEPSSRTLKRAEELDYPNFVHNRRLVELAHIPEAFDREALIHHIRQCLEQPGQFSQQRRDAFAKECGFLDGAANERLADACFQRMQRT